MQSTRFKDLRSKAKPEYKINVKRNLAVIEQIFAILDHKGWTQKQLADSMGKTESEISKWMTGTHNFTLLTISKIEAALGHDLLVTPIQAEKQWVSIAVPEVKPATPATFISYGTYSVQKSFCTPVTGTEVCVASPSDFQRQWELIGNFFEDKLEKSTVNATEETQVNAA